MSAFELINEASEFIVNMDEIDGDEVEVEITGDMEGKGPTLDCKCKCDSI